MVKYVSSQDEGELLPNVLNLTEHEAIVKAEFEGFLLAEPMVVQQECLQI